MTALQHLSRAGTTEVLQHVARYRLTTATALRQALPALCPTRRSAERKLIRLVDDGLLTLAPLMKHERYAFLTSQGSEVLGGKATSPGQAFAELPKLRCFAWLAFCCLGNTRRERLLPDELRIAFPELNRPGVPLSFYRTLTESDAEASFGFARIDPCGHGRWDRIVAAVLSDIRQLAPLPTVKRLIAEQRFEYSLITALPQKARRVRAALAQKAESRVLRINVVALPLLLPLIAPDPR